MDLSAIVIVLILAIPLFFFWRWIFRNYNSFKRRKILIWLVTIISAPILYTVLIIGWIFIDEYYPNNDFDPKAWKVDSDIRYEYSHELIKSNILIGKNKKEVIALLGNNSDTSQSEWYYYIGYRPELTGIDPSNIVVDFKKGKVDMVTENDK